MGYSENIKPLGYWQWGIFDLVNKLITNFNAVLTKLDADGGVAEIGRAHV